MKRRQTSSYLVPLLATLSLAISQWSCSSGSNAAKDVGAKNPVAGGQQNDSDSDSDNDPSKSWKHEWVSDVSDTKLKPCEAGKPFANGKCYDEVHFTDESITLKNPDETFTFVESGKPLTPFILEHYVFSKVYGEDFILINERSVDNKGAQLGHPFQYWFLPAKIKVSKSANRNDLSKSVFIGAQFPLTLNYGDGDDNEIRQPESKFFRGSFSICGKKIPLPLSDKTIESNCNQALLPGQTISDFMTPFGRTFLYLESEESPFPDHRAHHVVIGDIFGVE